MFRWRCRRRACRRKKERRRSTKKKIPPNCWGCGTLMILDKYRTRKIEAKKRNCYCSSIKFQPHAKDYCKRKEKKEYEESCQSVSPAPLCEPES